jgi:diketogulonate reductase-like aldo/keto reductase
MIPNFKLSNGVEVPSIGLGTFLIEDGEEAARCIRDAVSVGYRSFDTAMIYLNESGVGRGIRDCQVPREELFVTTKLWNDSHGYDNALRAFDASMKKLGLDYIDEYLMHWPGLDDQFIPTWKAMEKLLQDGLVRVIGVCNFIKPILQKLLDNCEVKPLINQLEMHPFFQPNDLVTFCQRNDIQVEAWRPIVWGKLDKEPILSLSKKHHKSPVQIALRWLFDRNIRSLPKTAHKERMIENLDIFNFQLTDKEIEQINAMNTFVRTGESPDEFFETGTF